MQCFFIRNIINTHTKAITDDYDDHDEGDDDELIVAVPITSSSSFSY